jgi:hypothetical protein
MQVFISWSGDKSRNVAEALRQWLPNVLQGISPFVSSRDLSAGTRWAVELAEKLKETEFGLVCVTRENQEEPWLNFEAGAIAKKLEVSRVVPLAIDLAPAEINHPLGQFQATRTTKEGLENVVKAMNAASTSPIPADNLVAALDKWWPDLEVDLRKIDETPYGDEREPSTPGRSDREMLEEVLDTVRGLSRGTPPRPVEDDPLNDGLRTIFMDAGATYWSVAPRSDHEYDVSVNLPITAQLKANVDLIGKIHQVKINLSQRAWSPPSPADGGG